MQAAGPLRAAVSAARRWSRLAGRARRRRDYAAPLAARYFNMRKTTIYGGSNEIQRNIIAQHTGL